MYMYIYIYIYIYILIFIYIYIYYVIHIYIYIYNIHTTGFADLVFQVCTKVTILQFVLLILRCIDVRYKADVISLGPLI